MKIQLSMKNNRVSNFKNTQTKKSNKKGPKKNLKIFKKFY